MLTQYFSAIWHHKATMTNTRETNRLYISVSHNQTHSTSVSFTLSNSVISLLSSFTRALILRTRHRSRTQSQHRSSLKNQKANCDTWLKFSSLYLAGMKLQYWRNFPNHLIIRHAMILVNITSTPPLTHWPLGNLIEIFYNSEGN